MTEPITLDQARAQLRQPDPAENDLIAGLIVAAREHVEDYTGLVLTPREVVQAVTGFGRWIDLAAWPVQEIISISYLDASGNEQTVDAGRYFGAPAKRPYRLRPTAAGWGVSGCAIDAVFPVTVKLEAGFASPDDVPATIKQAMLLLIDTWFNNRDGGGDIPMAVGALLRRWRMWML